MYNQPQRAKRLYFDVDPPRGGRIHRQPRQAAGRTRPRQPGLAHPCRPRAQPRRQPDLVRHAAQPRQRGERRQPGHPWGFIRRYVPGATPRPQPLLARLVDHAIAYYRDFVRPEKHYRQPTAIEREALEDLAATLAHRADSAAETIQNAVFEVGKRHPFPELRTWFGCLYQVLLGQQEGPRFGGFVALYGIPETIALIQPALARQADAA